MEWRPSRILTICVMVLAVNYLITDHRCSILQHEQETFRVANATILSATLHQQWSLGTFFSCLVDVLYTPVLTSSAAAASASGASSSSSSSDNGSDSNSSSNDGSASSSSSSVASPPVDNQSWPPASSNSMHRVRHTSNTNLATATPTNNGLIDGAPQKVWVELSCPSASFCQHHCQIGNGEQLWYDPSSPSPTRRLSWQPPDAQSCYGFIMGVSIAMGICTLGIIADWMVDRKCPARPLHNDLAALLASSSRGYHGYGGTANASGFGYGSTASSAVYRGQHSNIHGY